MANVFWLLIGQIQLSSYSKYYQKRREEIRGTEKKSHKGKIVMISFQQALSVRGRVDPFTLFISTGREGGREGG